MAVVLEFTSLPYPGLRPFKEEESDIFFGREKHTDQLLTLLGENRFVTVIGSSGSGKSSLVRAGLLPALKAGFLASAGSRWWICELRPGDRPLERLADTLASTDVLGNDRSEESVAFLKATVRRGPLGLIEFVKSTKALRNTNLLVLVDQFEEIFRYRERIAADQADAFVALLLASVAQRELSIYVVITMRSDYLGECSVFYALPEAVSASQYLTPRLTHEELERAIAGPARIFGGEVEPKLVNQLINDFGADQDQLPLLQHALARLWSRAERSDERLTVDDYRQIGGLGDALSLHGDEILAELTPQQQRIAEVMFKRLSETENGRRDVRRPARVMEVAQVANADWHEVIAVAEAFSRPDRSFISIPKGPLTEETVLDISHESLIRRWRSLSSWLSAESQSAEMYRRLRDWGLRWAQGNAELWRGPDLAAALAWRQRENPSPDWAQRYGDRDGFQVAMHFLDASEKARRAAVAAEETKRQQQLHRIRRLAVIFGTATAILVMAILSYCVAYVWDYNAYYGDYVKVWGVPKGLRPRGATDIGHHAFSYLITRRGRWGPVIGMQLVNAAGRARNLKGTVEAVETQEDFEKQVSRWEYVYRPGATRENQRRKLVYENYIDTNGRRLLSIVYAPMERGSEDTRLIYKIRPDGSLMRDNGSCVAFERSSYSPQGYKTKTDYLDQDGVPAATTTGVFGLKRKYDQQGNLVGELSLAKDGALLNDTTGVAERRIVYDKSGYEVGHEMLDAAHRPVNIEVSALNVLLMKMQKDVCKVDATGQCIEYRAWLADGSPALLAGVCQSVQFGYDDRGNIIRSVCLRDGRPQRSGWAIHEVKYDNDDRPVAEKYFDWHGKPDSGPQGASQVRVALSENGIDMSLYGPSESPIVGNDGYHTLISTFNKDGYEVRREYRGTRGELVAIKDGYAAVAKEFDRRGNEVTTSYFGVDNHLVPNRAEGFTIKKTRFDECGREIESRFFDKDGHLIPSLQGYAGVQKTYDEGNNVVEETYLNAKRRPTLSVDGYASVTRKYDRNHNLTEERYFDEGGDPTLVSGAYTQHTWYNDHNALLEEAFFDKNRNLVPNDKGWARHTLRYDDRNALVEEAYFGTNGRAVLSENGYARAVYINDKYGQEIEIDYFAPDGKPAEVHGYSKLANRRDENEAVIEESYFAEDGAPVLSDGGFARLTNDRDDTGRAVGWAFFGLKGEPVAAKPQGYHRAKQIFDNRGNVTETLFFGTDDKPIKSPEGYARRIDTFGPHNENTSEAYFGVNGNPVVSDDGYSKTILTNNAYGDLIEEKYFGINGEPVMSKYGISSVTITNDDMGRLIERKYYGVRGEPSALKSGEHRLKRVLDERGNSLDTAAFGTDGKPVEIADWWGLPKTQRCARVIRGYDAAKNVISWQCFDALGKLKRQR